MQAQDPGASESDPLLRPGPAREGGGGVEAAFESSDGYSAFFLASSLSIGGMFFAMPYFTDGTSGKSTQQQFLYEEAATFGEWFASP